MDVRQLRRVYRGFAEESEFAARAGLPSKAVGVVDVRIHAVDRRREARGPAGCDQM
ncbi:hypothetical protein Pd630_LPD14017 (plasmid) [Rhodococcus opacus PD630]|nr:hypothetical protein Pd630_LPD14017 [Rhodococcus opacus PD630]